MTATRSFYASIVALVALCVTPLSAMADNVLSSIIERDYSPQADSLTTVLVRKFMNPSKGTFWAVPNNQSNRESETTYIYWQQAHAMDVLVYAYERTKDSNPNQAETYKRSIGLWYKNHANNWYHDSSDTTGFLNTFTDDMCWICLTLLHIADALDDEQYAQTARTVFDNYIAPRGWADDDGFWGLPWKLDDRGRNACTNAPGCLVACKLYERYADEYYRQVAIDIYNYQANEMKTKLNNDGRVEEPPLTYTQGTFGEACRHLYHITGDDSYMTMATKVIHYLCTSTRCVDRGILRHEGTSMDQSIFKAVAVPYIANMALDEDVSLSYRRVFTRFLQNNAKKLWANLNLSKYPATYCNYYWGEPVDESAVPSMGAMASGCSLMESMARVALRLLGDESAIHAVEPAAPAADRAVYSLYGRLIERHADSATPLKSGIYIVGNKKVVVR